MAILNKCSMDLMLLLISMSKQEVAKIVTETNKVQEELKLTCSWEVFDSKIIEKSVKRF